MTGRDGADMRPGRGLAEDDSPGGGSGHSEDASRGALALRALAHPLRWKLIDLLGNEDSATATRCAEVLGESVPSCAYHLGILAKYGYVELVPGQVGREKPWRLTSYRQELSGEGLGIEGELAAQAATEAFLDHEIARIKDRLRSRSLEPGEWRDSSRLLGSTMWMTAEEFKRLSEQLAELAERYVDRHEHPARRPAESRQARVFLSISVLPEPRGTQQQGG